MRALVTGAGGYIGNILPDFFIKKSHEIVAFGRFLFGYRRNNYPEVDKLEVDICAIPVEDLENAIKGADVVVYLDMLSNDPKLSSRDLNFRPLDSFRSLFKYGGDSN